MKKSDVAVVVLLFILLVGWIAFSPKFFRQAPRGAESAALVAPTNGTGGAEAQVGVKGAPITQADAKPVEVSRANGPILSSNSVAREVAHHSANAPNIVTLSGTGVCISVSSWGGGVSAVRLDEYRANLTTNNSGPIVLDFSALQALAYNGLPGLSENCDFDVAISNNAVRVSRETDEKLRFVRLISFTKNYLVKVTDEFSNLGSEPVVLPEHSINIGPMRHNKGETSSMGLSDLGIDSKARRGKLDTRYWGSGSGLGGESSLAASFLPLDRRSGCSWFKPALTKWLEPEFGRTIVSETDWVAVKNKFFVQVLIPGKDDAGSGFAMHVRRAVAPSVLRCTAGSLKGEVFPITGDKVTIGRAADSALVINDPSVAATNCVLVRDGLNYSLSQHATSAQDGAALDAIRGRRLATGDSVQIGDLTFVFQDGERPDVQSTWSSAAAIEEVSAAMVFEERKLQPGESFSRELDYYVGPKKYSLLRDLGKKTSEDKGKQCDKIMEFGFWEVVCIPLLWIMNAINCVVPNYGVVIILLTILIRLVFWPVMQKSAENSKKMQELQPQLAALKEQYKDDQPQYLKKQQELFKENKVSVLGGCLPMLIQLPVLFSLFVVLRSSVELRGATFLWIRDLSEPERLFAGILPFWPHHLNILPILMTVVQIFQMKITPTPGDQQMQKMMLIFMPLFMLYLLYDMASGLVLYWTVSQFLAIVQILLTNRKDLKKGNKTSGPVLVPVRKK